MITLSERIKSLIFWISISLIFLIIFGIFIIDIFATDAQDKEKLSIVFSYLSTVFAFLSALGLFTTIIIYFRQRKDLEILEKIKDRKLTEAYFNIFKNYTKKLIIITKQLIEFKKLINDENCRYVDVIIGENIYAFVALDSKNEQISNATIYEFDIDSLSLIYANSTSSNPIISLNYYYLYDFSSKSKIMIDNLIIKIKQRNSKQDATEFLNTINLEDSLLFLSDIENDFKLYFDEL
ncbi:hypothetical protein [Proteus mirabilis]|uniref:hypothetical protein n=4 Tax=Proteus mirabilis TaxID=584 RepID=UPI00107238FD|nr:hypothetical protein [Proteus mirabilis]MCD4601991.1 hypothetical protein [Proteus mirabilis]MCD4616192.1 hypothetical protein [Proteus mirabilis]MCD4635649.1 hypothetical protein [Proteus mirabilis]MDM3758142.1 hypothetical protein [Proteus mirabilis]MDM3761745.1 hypothetical protein [Proteus mirabilis]